MRCRVVQSTWGTFHHMDLAAQLHRQNMLSALFSSFPLWKLKRFGLPSQKVHSTTHLHAALMAKWRWIGAHERIDRWIGRKVVEAHTRFLTDHLPPCEVLVALSGSGLEAGALVQQRGGAYVCDRGSAHIRFVEEILTQEFAIWGQQFPTGAPDMISREEQEYGLADVITVPSSFAANSFIQMGVPAERLRTIPYGVDLRRFRKVAEPPTDSFEVLFVGAVSFQKGVPYLLQAFDQLQVGRKRLRLVGAMQDEMAQFLRGRSFESVEFLGPRAQPDLVPLMNASHVMVLPSVQDGFGMVLAQAMACGCPVICSSNTAGNDLVQHGKEGFIVPIRDAEQIAVRLKEIKEDSNLRLRMSEAALQRVTRVGGWDQYGNQFGELCRALARDALQAPSPNRFSVNAACPIG